METFSHSTSLVSLLYVEDDPVSRELVCTAVSRKHPDMVIHIADNGEDGLRLYKELKPDIILADICMPVIDGIRMAKEILALEPAAKIIAATAVSDTHFMLDAIKIGISRYVVKPFDFRLLFAAINDCVSQVTLEKKMKSQTDFLRQLSRAVEQSPRMVIITDAGGGIEYVNAKFTSITGYRAEEVLGQNLRSRLTKVAPPEELEFLWSQITCGSEWRGEFVNRKKGGEPYDEELLIAPLTTEEGDITNFVAVMEDISERKQVDKKIRGLIDELELRLRETQHHPPSPPVCRFTT